MKTFKSNKGLHVKRLVSVFVRSMPTVYPIKGPASCSFRSTHA